MSYLKALKNVKLLLCYVENFSFLVNTIYSFIFTCEGSPLYATHQSENQGQRFAVVLY